MSENGTRQQTVQILCNQAIRKCLELHALLRKTTRTPHAVRTYIPQAGHLFSSLDTCSYAVCTIYKPQHGSSTAKTMKMKPKFSERKKIPVLSHVINFCLVGTAYIGQKEKETSSRASLSASYGACPFCDHLTTDSVREKLFSLSATVIPVARLV